MKYLISLSLSFILIALSINACPSKFNNKQLYFDAISKCISSGEIKNPAELEEILKDSTRNDKCMAKCVIKKLCAAEKFDMDAVYSYLQDQAPPEMLTKLMESATKCGETAGVDQLMDEEGLEADTVCEIYHDFYACVVTQATKLC